MALPRSSFIRLLEKPTVARSFSYVFFVLVLAAGAETNAQAPARVSALTESEVVARALQRAPLQDAVEGAVSVEEGRGRAASAYPNPQLSYTREQTFGALGSGEDYLSLAQTLDLGNRRGLQGDAGGVRAEAARQEGDATRLDVAAAARLRFFDVLHRERQVTALESWTGRIEQALGIVTRREQRGDAAAYDRTRLERERAVAAGRLSIERTELERARARLLGLIGMRGSLPPLSGALLPDADPAALATLRASSASRPELRALDLRIEAAALDRSAADRWWAPDLRVEAGWKGVDLGRQGRTDGFLIAASLSFPLWDQSSGLAQLAEGESRAARGQRGLLVSQLDAEIGGAHAQAIGLRRAASEFGEQTSATSGDLVRIASAGYEGGELGLLELLDAYRGAADDALIVLDMELAARRARIELDRLTGAGLP